MNRHDVITVIRDPKQPLGKVYSVSADGSIIKESSVKVGRATAVMRHVPDHEALQALLIEVASDPHAAIINAGFHGVEVGEEFLLLPEDAIAKGLDDETRAKGRDGTKGVHISDDGKKVLGRLKENVYPSRWQVLDRDVDAHTPDEFGKGMNFAAWLSDMSRILPALDATSYVRAESSSARVENPDGTRKAGSNGHVWVKVQDPDDVNRVGHLAIRTRAIELGLSWLKPRFSRIEAGKVTGYSPTTLVDASVWTPGRIVFVGQPTVGTEFKLLPQAVEVVKGSNDMLDTSRAEATPESTVAALKSVNIQARVSTGKDGTVGVHVYDLTDDTELERKDGSVITVAEAFAAGKPFKCQSPFRASASLAGWFKVGDDGIPFVYDHGTDETHYPPQAAANTKRRHSEFSIASDAGTRAPGVYWQEPAAAGDDPKPPMRICGPLEVVADTRDAGNSNWGRLLRWLDKEGHPHEWACPNEMLGATDTAEFRRVLLRGGLFIATNPKARTKLADYVQLHPPTLTALARCVNRTGWVGDRYVLAGATFGAQGVEEVVYQGAAEADISTAGTLAGWQQEVAALAAGNSRPVFAISCAFAGVLVGMTSEAGGGFQLTGKTTGGKTSICAEPAASVWGHPERFARKWRTTANGLEGLCLSRNDNVLILDDLGQANARECGASAYLIANGQAKARMHKEGGNRPTATWKTLLLSTGEIDLAQHMVEAGQTTRGGQSVRMPSIPADAGKGLGVLEELHGQPDGRMFSDTIKDAARRHYGHAGIAYLDKLTEPDTLATLRAEVGSMISGYIAQLNIAPGAAPEVGRVAARFALVAVAAELATKLGVTGWKPGEAFKAAKRCFDDWQAESGGTFGSDDRALLSKVKSFFEAHGASRFEDVGSNGDTRIPNRAGFVRTNVSNGREYLVFPEVFANEVCKGYNSKTAAAVLVKVGWIEPGKDGKASQKPRLPNIGPTRCYVFTGKLWEGEQ